MGHTALWYQRGPAPGLGRVRDLSFGVGLMAQPGNFWMCAVAQLAIPSLVTSKYKVKPVEEAEWGGERWGSLVEELS